MKRTLLILFAFTCFQSSSYASLSDLIDPVVLSNKVNQQIDRLNLSFTAGLEEGNLLGAQFKYEVSPSYKAHNYNRIDRYNIGVNLNIGSIVKELCDTPLSFSVGLNQSFFFVRQFPKKINAIKALPYSPNRLPLNAKRALEKLEIGDFASIPANLNIAVSANASTEIVNPFLINANANAYWIIGGEFNIQVYKLDDKHVRLRMITTRAYNRGTSAGLSAGFNILGINAIERRIEKWIDHDMIQLGMSVAPGSQFILDYVFDLTDQKAALAYNEILGSTFKFKDIVIIKNFGENSEIKNKLFTTYEKADALALEDAGLPVEKQRIRRLFKGFTNSIAKTKHLKLGLFLLNYTNNQTFSKNDLTFVDDSETEHEFSYPTFTQYKYSRLGIKLVGYEDMEALTCFGLLPKNQNKNASEKRPEIGINFDQTDAIFTPNEQVKAKRALMNQVPSSIAKKIDWMPSDDKKHFSRLSYKLILKAEAIPYLRDYQEKEFQKRFFQYVTSKNANYLFQEYEIRSLGNQIFHLLQKTKADPEIPLIELIGLNKHKIFKEMGIGFLTSLLPEEKLEDLIYFKLEMVALHENEVQFEYGMLNHEGLYRELTELQSKITNRSYDLRVPNPTEP